MATRKFQLPGIQDLTKEQERVRALPLVRAAPNRGGSRYG